jgi:excisionase family DNA binding protein
MVKRNFFTTFEISQICGVNPTTVQNWVKGKKLIAFQTPGGHRRVRRENLVSFLKEFGMPIPDDLLQSAPLILIADDDPDILDLLATVMRSGAEEVSISTAQNGIDALVMIGENKPDLLILDIMMPGMNGCDVCRKLKSSLGTKNIRIVAISGDHNPAVKERALTAGADLFFTKPLEIVGFREQCFRLLSM